MFFPARIVRHVDPFATTQRELEALLGRWAESEVGGGKGEVNSGAGYAVDVRENAERLVLEAELPGFSREQVQITLENQQLTILAERGETRRGEEESFLLKERGHRRFQRSFTLPATVDGASVDAKLEQGVLTVTLGKRQEAKPRKIPVG